MLRIKNSQNIRYYLYVSDLKVNMLFEQMFAAGKRTRRGKVTVKAGPVTGSRETETEDGELDRDDKLRAIEDSLTNENLVGTPQNPKDYFRGILPMRWGLYDDHGTRPDGYPPLVYFGGFDPTAPLIVGLGGSSVHVHGFQGATSTHSRSATPTLVEWLLGGMSDGDGHLGALRQKARVLGDGMLYEAVGIALHYLRPPTQQLEFLAKTISVGTLYGFEHMTGFNGETKIVLGTPLYVQQTNMIPEDELYGLDDEWQEHVDKLLPAARES